MILTLKNNPLSDFYRGFLYPFRAFRFIRKNISLSPFSSMSWS
jgi:hypothetical protein